MMLIRLLQGGVLLALTVAIHAVMLSATLNRLYNRYHGKVGFGVLSYSWLLVRIAAVTVFAHLLEIVLWGSFYALTGALPSLEQSLYFSSVTYATIGYGDIVLPETWRLLAAMEGLTGILMCAWSGAFFFAIVSKLHVRSPEE